jgi:type II secretory pathway pseudopilin PulG
MTLLEMLVVIAIVALVMVALLAYLWPTDDRRCRSEAERLAAWIMGTRAESVMREGPVRAAFDFSAQTVIRELGRDGASIADLGFKADDRAEVFKTKNPVEFTMLRVAGLGDLTNATAWMVFADYRTVGGVVVLELNEAIYSVVVGPGRDGEVLVVPGKAEVLKAAPPRVGGLFAANGFSLDNTPFAPEFMPSLNPGGGLNDSVLPPVGQPSPPVENDPNPPHDDPPTEDPPATPSPPVDGIDDNPVDEEPEEEEEEPEEEVECRLPDKPCPGLYEACLEQKCVAQPTDLALRVVNARITEPQAVAAVLQPIFQSEINAGRFNLTVKFIAPTDQSPQANYMAALVQATASPSGFFMPNDRLPSYTQNAQRMAQCSGSYTHCYELSVEQSLRLYVRRASNVPGQCDYNALAIAGRTSAFMTIPPGAMMPSQVQGMLSVFGYLDGVQAQQTTFATGNGIEKTLAQALYDYGAEPTIDLNGDGTNESWKFQLEGTAVGVQMPFIQADPNRDPCN